MSLPGQVVHIKNFQQMMGRSYGFLSALSKDFYCFFIFFSFSAKRAVSDWVMETNDGQDGCIMLFILGLSGQRIPAGPGLKSGYMHP